MRITVYTKPNCVQCNFTKRELDAVGLEYTAVDVTQDAQAADALAVAGHKTLPVVMVDGIGDFCGKVWSGFKPEKIRALAQLDPANP